MTATAGLTSDLQKQVLLLEDNLRTRVQDDAERLATWKTEHAEAVKRQRTSSTWMEWRDDRVTQAAVAWVLTTVFVRFCEDNALVKPVWIAGPALRRQEALDAQLAFFRAHPEDTDREWLQQCVDYLAIMPSTAALVDSHSALRLVSPSGNAAAALLAFWRRKDDDGQLMYDLTDSTLSTRFLGDLYQDLSEYAKKTFALLQTPVFVEEFILDQTLEPALTERPLEGFMLIDPTCGSGHFLLGAFGRLLARWDRWAPGLEIQARVQLALDAIHGVDLNPFAVAIARFRLTVLALQECGLSSLEQAPAFQFHLAVGDSLLHGQDQYAMSYDDFDADLALSGFAYATEDLVLLREILQPGRYDAVVGNPPYITVKDKTLNKAYREIYRSCKGAYSLSVPFMERFFGLAKSGSHSQPAGWVGQITSNSFMKREFGSKLIEDFLPTVDLVLVINSEGAWIPGHNTDGTPTVILVGRNQSPVSEKIRAILSKGKRETRAVGDDGRGPYWNAIVRRLGEPGYDDDWVTVADVARQGLARHPWSLAGGGASALMAAIGVASDRRLADVVPDIGFGAVTREDDAYMLGSRALLRRGVSPDHRRCLVEGQAIRDWGISAQDESLWPYNPDTLEAETDPGTDRVLWTVRTLLSVRVAYGMTQTARGLEWFEYSMFFRSRYRGTTLAIPSVASHVHAALDSKSRVFKDTSILVNLGEEPQPEELYGLLGLLNSSAACFWVKMQSQPKGGAAAHIWARTYQVTGSTLQDLPLAGKLPHVSGRALADLSESLDYIRRDATNSLNRISMASLEATQSKYERTREEMISRQEELDWEVYRLYGLLEEDLTYPGDDLPGLALGARAFEIALARDVASGSEETSWFSRHRSMPLTGFPAEWPVAYRELVQRRLDLIASDPSIRLLERPEYKRRWVSEPWEKQQSAALRDCVLDRLEDRSFWFDAQGRPQPRSIAQLADQVSRDTDLLSVLALWEGRPDVRVSDSLVRLLTDESVPYLAAHRLNNSGLRKREAWEQTWALQRSEDAGEKVGPIPVPPKYKSTDFRKASSWRARGKLDVPKERFILYPDAGRETDPTPLLGWAGWDHAQQSLALSLVLGAREADGWEDNRLVPLVAGLAELQPWVEQWHAEVDPTYGVSLAAFCREQLTARATQVGKTPEELASWRPAIPTRGRRPSTEVTS